jgi:acetyl esterase/lipase
MPPMYRVAFAILLSASVATSVHGQQRAYPPKLEGAAEHVYKTVGETKLKLWVYAPEGHQPTDAKPAIVFFFGGGWTNGSPQQFEQQCRYLASRGMVAITADYRVASRQNVKAVDCVRDAKSAVRWIRSHASELGVDPDRIAAGGGSAGGHIAACAGTIEDFDEPDEDASVSSRPNSLVLFNPAVSFDPSLTRNENPRAAGLAERMGVEPTALSPANHVDATDPPTIVLIGTKDFLIEGNRQFAQRMQAAGVRCELDLYEGRTHGFFNYGRAGNKDFLATLASADRFLASLGWIEGEPTVETFFANER